MILLLLSVAITVINAQHKDHLVLDVFFSIVYNTSRDSCFLITVDLINDVKEARKRMFKKKRMLKISAKYVEIKEHVLN